MINPVPIQNPVDDLLDLPTWQWQSGSDPDLWAEIDKAKWFWKDYSDDDCLIIEQAFSLDKKGIADLKDYEVDFESMVQVNKKDKNKIRRVQRLQKSRFLLEMPKPAPVGDEKTMNEAFGPLQHFLDYIMKRTPKAYELYQRLKGLSLDSKNAEFQDVIKEVIECIEKGAGFRQEIIKVRSPSAAKKFLTQSEKIVDVIKTNSTVLRDFLKAMLKVYTMETFICYWLNDLLRSENWQEINVLTPYLVCLVYTFKLPEYIIQYQKPQKFRESLASILVKQKLFLYRGTALTKEHLELYNTKKLKYFSWNSVTSTSRSESEAQKFLEMSLKPLKIGVLFTIETDFASIKDCEGMIDVSQISKYPNEQEVIIAPGTVFKLQKIRLNTKGTSKINLKIKRNIKTKKVKKALLGTLQDQGILKETAVIRGFPSKESFKLLKLVRGNESIRSVQIRDSQLDEDTMEKIESVRLTTNVKKQDIKLRGNEIIVSSLALLAHYFSAEQLTDLCSSNNIQFKEENIKNKFERTKVLTLRREAFDMFDWRSDLWKKIKNESQLIDLEISLGELDHSRISNILDCIKELKCLKNLKLTLNEMQISSKQDLQLLCKTIGSIQTLNQLSLELTCSDERLKDLKTSLLSFVNIQNLSLNFRSFEKISDEGLNHLKTSLTSLSFLQHLLLDFSFCEKISDEGLNHLKTGLKSSTSLQYLSLKFRKCLNISNQGLDHLKDGLLPLTSLKFLSLNFHSCEKISDEGLNHLKTVLTSFSFLQQLSLNLDYCEKISDEGLNHLKTGLKSSTSLQKLSLNFSECKISNHALNHLKDSLLSLTSLQSLFLTFHRCQEISDEGVSHLKTVIASLTSLQHLAIAFPRAISNEEIDRFKSSLILLTSLQSLSLDFSYCQKVSDEGLNSLKAALIALTSLQQLSLNFLHCREISNQGLNHLKDGLLSRKFLQILVLNLEYCKKISDEGLNHLKTALLALTTLQQLSLRFCTEDSVSEKGLDNLRRAILLLPSLQNLDFHFDGYKESFKKNADFIMYTFGNFGRVNFPGF